MAISEQQRQKKLAKKKQKRANVTRSPAASNASKMITATDYPVHECLIPTNLFEAGLGELVITRKLPGDNIAIAAFVLDVFCLGIKEAMFRALSEAEYQDLKNRFTENGAREFRNVDPACGKQLLDGLVAYANDLGFSPHKDYHTAKGMFGNLEADACGETFSYGKDGKPFYMKGPFENQVQARKIIETLSKKCGDDGFAYVVDED